MEPAGGAAGWLTKHGGYRANEYQPQWSQPRTDWMTAPVPDVQRDDHDAAMDPTENRPDDRPFWASRSSSTISRNGAGHELAG